MAFKKATTKGRYARISAQGPSGSGKTTSALRIARGLSPNGKIAVLDGEAGRSELEAERIAGGFDVNIMERTGPEDFVRELRAAARAGYDVVIIDSLSAAWEALLAEKDTMPTKDQFTGWSKLTPKHNAFLEAIKTYPGHVIVTMRSKTKYEIQQVEKKGRDGRVREVAQPVKIGMEPVARGGTEYEFDLAFELDHESNCWLNKRPRGAFGFTIDQRWHEPGEELGREIAERLGHVEPTPDNGAQTQPPANVVDHPAVRQTTEALGGEVSGARAPRTETPIQIEDWADTAHRMLTDLRAQLSESTLEGFVFDGNPPASLDRFFSPAEIQARGREDGRRLVAVMREAVAVQAGGAA